MIVRFFQDYTLHGFLRAMIIFAVVMLPNCLYFALPKYHMTEWQPEIGKIVDFLENGMRIMYFILLFVVTPSHTTRKNSIFLYVAGVALLLYYVCWCIYFAHHMDCTYLTKPFLGIPVPMALFPIIFLVSIGVWMNSYLLAGCGVFFGIAHIANSYSVYLQSIRG